MFRSSVAAFYFLLKCLFYSFSDAVRGNWFAILVQRRLHPEVEKIVHWVAEILLAAEIAFGGLDRCMTE